MNTFTSNIVILTANLTEQNITGTAMSTSGISLKYAVVNNEVNQSIFLPESQLVVSGYLRIGAEIATMGVRIVNILAVVSVPAAPAEAVAAEVPAPALNLAPDHLKTLKIDELKAIAAQLGVAAVKNKKTDWIEAILAATAPAVEPEAKAVTAEVVTEAEPVPF